MTAIAAEEVAVSWRDAAACRGSKIDFTSGEPQDVSAAKMICAQCPVRDQCLEDGRGEEYGVWGGTTPAERGVTRMALSTRCLSCSGILLRFDGARDRCASCGHVWYRRQEGK